MAINKFKHKINFKYYNANLQHDKWVIQIKIKIFGIGYVNFFLQNGKHTYIVGL